MAGCALYIPTIATYGARSRDSHATLGYALGSLSIFSQLQVPFALQQHCGFGSNLRMLILLAYVVAQAWTTAEFSSTKMALGIVAATVSVYGAALALLIFGVSHFGLFRRFNSCVRLSPLAQMLLDLSVCCAATIWYLYRVLRLKLDHPDTCNLNTPEENEWTLGQMYASIMLVALFLPAVDASPGMYQPQIL